MAIKCLIKEVKADFAALPDEAAFWLKPEFAYIRVRKAEDRDRLTLAHVIARITHSRDPARWLTWHKQIATGEITLAEFVKRVIAKSPRHLYE